MPFKSFPPQCVCIRLATFRFHSKPQNRSFSKNAHRGTLTFTRISRTMAHQRGLLCASITATKPSFTATLAQRSPRCSQLLGGDAMSLPPCNTARVAMFNGHVFDSSTLKTASHPSHTYFGSLLSLGSSALLFLLFIFDTFSAACSEPDLSFSPAATVVTMMRTGVLSLR